MKKMLFSLWILTSMILSNVVQAYDEDVHFYQTYSMARFAGIKHEVAVKMALTTQWMDESYISDPMSMIFLPLTGIKKRRLLHFPSSRLAGELGRTTQQHVSGANKLSSMQVQFILEILKDLNVEIDPREIVFATETTEGHPLATEMLLIGLKTGNLMMSSASLHVLEDSYAHAGTPAEEGHAQYWHWPDRPYVSMEKFYRMTRSVFHALTAIRGQLPQDALDCSLNISATGPVTLPNCQREPQELYEQYRALPLVQSTVSKDITRDANFVRYALTQVQASAIRNGYIFPHKNTEFVKVLNSVVLDGKTNTYVALATILETIMLKQSANDPILNIVLMMQDSGLLKESKKNDKKIKLQDFAATYGYDLAKMDPSNVQRLSELIATAMLRWFVPKDLDDSHRFELEDDSGVIRKKEMEMRISNARRMVFSLYGSNLKLVGNNSKDYNGFMQELAMDSRAVTPVRTFVGGIEQVTFSLSEKKAFDLMILSYLYPSVSESELRTLLRINSKLVTVMDILKLKDDSAEGAVNEGSAAIYDTDESGTETKKSGVMSWVGDKWNAMTDSVSGTFSDISAYKELLSEIKNVDKFSGLLQKLLKDTMSAHSVPSPDNMIYFEPSLVAQYKQTGKFKVFLSEQDVWSKTVLRTSAPQAKIP